MSKKKQENNELDFQLGPLKIKGDRKDVRQLAYIALFSLSLIIIISIFKFTSSTLVTGGAIVGIITRLIKAIRKSWT